MFIVTSIVCGVFNVQSLFCFEVLCIVCSFAIASMGKRELVAVLFVYYCCVMNVMSLLALIDSSLRYYGLVCSV